MVIADCKVGSLPSLNARTTEQLEEWLQRNNSELDPTVDAPCAINLMMHCSNARRDEDLALAVKHPVPIMISALGSTRDGVEAIHSYGGQIYADVIYMSFAKRALAAGVDGLVLVAAGVDGLVLVAAGVDGLVLVAAGAGGHTGQLSGFALVEEVRRFWDGPVVV